MSDPSLPIRVLVQIDDREPTPIGEAHITADNRDDIVPALLEALAAEWRRTGRRP